MRKFLVLGLLVLSGCSSSHIAKVGDCYVIKGSYFKVVSVLSDLIAIAEDVSGERYTMTHTDAESAVKNQVNCSEFDLLRLKYESKK